MSISFSLTQIKEIAADQGYPLIMEDYAAEPLVYPLIAKVEDLGEVADALHPDWPFGYKARMMLGLDRPRQIEPGQEFPASTLVGGYTPQSKCRKLVRRIDLTQEDLNHRNVNDHVTARIVEDVAEWGKSFAAEEDQIFADFFQKGTLSAGHPATFQNNYQGRMGVTDGVIYDGKAFFATDHPQEDGSGATYSNLTVSAPLTEDTWAASRLRLRSTNAKTGRGLLFTAEPDTLMVPADLSDTAERLLGSAQKIGTSNNDINLAARRPYNLVVNRYLTDDATGWFAGSAGKGIRVMRGPIQMDVVPDPHTQSVSVLVWKRFLVLVDNARYWDANDKAAS